MFLPQSCQGHPAPGLAPSSKLSSTQNPSWPPMAQEESHAAWSVPAQIQLYCTCPTVTLKDAPRPGVCCTGMLINTSQPHFSAHPDVFLTVLCGVRSPSMLNSTATFQPPALSGLRPALEATLPSLGLTGIWIISSCGQVLGQISIALVKSECLTQL